jgi:catechol 1,2-dioxygenase
MRTVTEQTLTEAVVAAVANTKDPRTREVLTSLVKHLHAFIREVRLTEEEWLVGIRFLTATGQKCDELRQEFIMLSDTLGASALKDFVGNDSANEATEHSLLGPFYLEGARELAMGANLAKGVAGEPAVVSGRVLSGGRPLPGAVLDVWQAAPNGFYEGQDPAIPEGSLRARFRTGAGGRYEFRTVKPASYPVPMDGPVGRMLQATGRQAYRPAHIHFIITAPGHKAVTTELFVEGDPCLDADPVFGVRESLVVPFVKDGDGYRVEYDFSLAPL